MVCSNKRSHAGHGMPCICNRVQFAPASNRSSDEAAAWGDFEEETSELRNQQRTAKIQIKNSKRLSKRLQQSCFQRSNYFVWHGTQRHGHPLVGGHSVLFLRNPRFCTVFMYSFRPSMWEFQFMCDWNIFWNICWICWNHMESAKCLIFLDLSFHRGPVAKVGQAWKSLDASIQELSPDWWAIGSHWIHNAPIMHPSWIPQWIPLARKARRAVPWGLIRVEMRLRYSTSIRDVDVLDVLTFKTLLRLFRIFQNLSDFLGSPRNT